MKKLWIHTLVLFFCFALSASALPDQWQPIGPDGGSVLGIVSDPLDPDHAVAITHVPSSRFVYHTFDGGQSWSKIGPFPDYGASFQGMSAFDTNRIYVLRSDGCYRTTDGGVTWNFSAFPDSSSWAGSIRVDPLDPNKVHVAGAHGDYPTFGHVYFSSTDGGQNWSATYFGHGQSSTGIDVSVTDPNIIYISGYRVAGLGSSTRSMFRSMNGGATWADISDSVDSSQGGKLYSVAVDPTHSDRVYSSGWDAFYRSVDGGDTWTKDTSYEFYGKAIGIDPVNGAHLYVAGDDLFVSSDYGLTWTVHSGIIGVGSQVEVAPGDPSKIYLAANYLGYDSNSPGGIFKSTDWGATWNSAQAGITGQRINTLSVAPSQPETVFIDLYGAFTLMATYDSGDTLQEVTYPSPSEYLRDLMVDSRDEDTVLALSDALYRSTDGCATWSKNQDDVGLGQLMEDPNDPDTVYASGKEYSGGIDSLMLYKSTDGGLTWPTEMTIDSGVNSSSYAFEIAVSDSSVLYYLAMMNYYTTVFRSEDSGATWVNVTGNLDTLLDQFDFSYALWIDPDDEDRLLIGSEIGVFSTSNAGQIWSATSLTVHLYDFCYNPLFDTLYAATAQDGVYYSDDRGVTWQALNNGLDYLETRRLEVDPENGYLYLGTNGNSVWRRPITPQNFFKDAGEISASTSGVVNFSLDAGTDNAGIYYLILGSLSGSSPGITLPGGAVLPVNWDHFTDYVLAKLNSGTFVNFLGPLDGSGQASASLHLGPLAPKHIGKVMTYAYLLDWPFDFVSNPERITVVP